MRSTLGKAIGHLIKCHSGMTRDPADKRVLFFFFFFDMQVIY